MMHRLFLVLAMAMCLFGNLIFANPIVHAGLIADTTAATLFGRQDNRVECHDAKKGTGADASIIENREVQMFYDKHRAGDKAPSIAAHDCDRFACSSNSAVSLCNISDKTIDTESWEVIAQKTSNLNTMCRRDGWVNGEGYAKSLGGNLPYYIKIHRDTDKC